MFSFLDNKIQILRQFIGVFRFSLLGACGVILGLYIVLWGKAKDLEEIRKEHSEKKSSCNIDLEEPLLSEKSPTVDSNV